MTIFSFTLKSGHDDTADSLAMVAEYLENRIKTASVTKQAYRSGTR